MKSGEQPLRAKEIIRLFHGILRLHGARSHFSHARSRKHNIHSVFNRDRYSRQFFQLAAYRKKCHPRLFLRVSDHAECDPGMRCRLCFFLESARDPALFCDQIADIIRMDKRQIHFL